MFYQLKKYAKVWYLLAVNTIQITFVNRWSNVLFFLGKLIRLAMSLLVLWLIREQIKLVGPYTIDQLIIFFLVYHWIDLLSQTIYRGVYNFGQLVRSGDFDLFFVKPINILFLTLTGRPDVNDALFLLPSLIATIIIGSQIHVVLSVASVLWFLSLFINGLLIATGLHIFVLVIGIVTVEVDGIVWLYRDLLQLGQIPISLYGEPLRFLLFFLVPIGMMTTIPAEVLLAEQPTFHLLIVYAVGISFFLASLLAWRWGLKKYSSASS